MLYSSLMRSSRYQTMYSSSRFMNSSMPTPVKSLSWKNSCLGLPKNPSAAALSGLHPLRAHGPGQPVLPVDADPSGLR